MFLADLALNVDCFKSDGVVGDDRYSVPKVLGAFLFEEGDTACILSTQHWLDCELKLFFSS